MKQKERAPRRPIPGVQGQLMLFIGGMTLLTLGLVWALIAFWLQPQYNRQIRMGLESRVQAIVARINANDGPIATRYFDVLAYDTAFWDALAGDIQTGVINLDNCCLDISDSTCRNISFIENLYPCVLHETMSVLGGDQQKTIDSAVVIRQRQTLFAEGALYEIVESGGTRQMMVGLVSEDGSFGVIVSASLAQIGTTAQVLSTLIPPIALFLLFVDLVAAMVFSRWFTRPLHKLSEGAREIAAGNYDVQVDVERNDEVGLLTQEFNHMASEVKRSAQLEREILANVSHDLRTPLTLIKGYAETVRDITGDDAGKRTEQCDIIVDETDRLSALVNSVLELTKVSTGADKPNLIEFDMAQLCFEVAGLYDAVCEQNGWTLRLEADRACTVHADPGMMERVLHNLMGNATHHLGADGVFILRTVPLEGGGCRVEVEDHGPGIPPEELPHLFDRYYRARKDAGKPGTGLGLSITKAILQQHGFAFGVDSEVGKGSTFWFEMKDTRAQQ